MRIRPLFLFGALVAAGSVAAACSDRGGPADSPAGPETVMSRSPSSACDLGDIPQLAGALLGSQHTAQDFLARLQAACDADDAGLIGEESWQFLVLIEHLRDSGFFIDPNLGEAFVNRLVDCIEDASCATDGTNDLDVTDALSPRGLFAVRGSDSRPVYPLVAMDFIDFDTQANKAFFGLETDLTWTQATGTPRVLFYGAPVTTGVLDLQEVGFGGLQFDMNRYPIPPVGSPGNPFPDGALDVGVCFESEVTLPHLGGDESRPTLEPLMQREAVVLEDDQPAFCAEVFPNPQAASFLGALRALIPFWRSDRRAPSLGGTPLEFSRFAPIAVNPEGSLEFVSGPMARATEGEPIGTVQVRAISGEGTPVEKVMVTLTLKNNRGVPAGAELGGDIDLLTIEAGGIARFDDVTVGKPGGYILCATGVRDAFEFPEVCTGRFHVNKPKNDG